MEQVSEILRLFNLMRTCPGETEAIAHLERIWWGDSPCCSRCGATDQLTKQKKPGRFWCGCCRQYFNARTDTPLEYGKVPIHKRIDAACLLMTSRKGISAMQLPKELDISYPTSWNLLHRLRVACGDQMEALHGNVEIDEVYLGGKEANKHEHKKLKAGRGTVGKQAVLSMRERGGKVKAMPVPDTSKPTIQSIVRQDVRPGSTFYTDGERRYEGIANRYRTVNHSAKEYVNGMAHTNGIENVRVVLKRGFNGICHHWAKKYCRDYVNEFAVRLNEGDYERDTQDQLDDLSRGMVGKTVNHEELVA